MILVAGEALVDLVIAPDGSVEAALGGAPFNAARAAARLGADVGFGGVLSRDRFGTLLADRLTADGVAVDAAVRTDAPTTLAAAEIDGGGAARYRFYVEGTSASALPTLEVGAATDTLFTGGLGLALRPMADTIADAVERARDDVLVVVDVNCRPTVIADRDRYVARLARVLARADVVKVSDEDLDYLAPGVPADDAASSLLDAGARAVLITAGSKSTTILDASGRVEVPVEQVTAPVVDTIGAGDTFAGALLAWWQANGLGRADVEPTTLEPAVRSAHAAAAVVVTRRGADPPTRADLGTRWLVRTAG